MKAELRKAVDEAVQKFAKHEDRKSVAAAKTIKSICWGFGDCEWCPFFINESEHYPDCMLLVLLALLPDHWILSEEKEEREMEQEHGKRE